MPQLQRQISSRHFAELMLYDQIFGIPDSMQLERMVAGAIGIKKYKPPKKAAGNIGQAFGQLVSMARKNA